MKTTYDEMGELRAEIALLRARIIKLEEKVGRPGHWFELEERGLLGEDGDIRF
jgi:hypothetical protein